MESEDFRGKIRCWGCDKSGHLLRDCFEWRRKRAKAAVERESRETVKSGEFSGKIRCWGCDRIGHLLRDCIEWRRKRAGAPSPMFRDPKPEDREQGNIRSAERVNNDERKQKCSVTSIPISRLAGIGESLTTRGDIDGRNCLMTLDTGANRTIVRSDIIASGIKSIPGLQLQTATGETAVIKGKKEVSLGIGNRQFHHEVLVADIVDDVILGMDFMKANKFLLDFGRGVVNCNGVELPLLMKNENVVIRRVTVVEQREELSTDAETVVRGGLKGNCGPQRKRGSSPKTQTKRKGSNNVVTQRSVFTYQNKVGQRVVHLKRITLYRGGDLDPVRDEQVWVEGSVTNRPM